MGISYMITFVHDFISGVKNVLTNWTLGYGLQSFICKVTVIGAIEKTLLFGHINHPYV